MHEWIDGWIDGWMDGWIYTYIHMIYMNFIVNK